MAARCCQGACCKGCGVRYVGGASRPGALCSAPWPCRIYPSSAVVEHVGMCCSTFAFCIMRDVYCRCNDPHLCVAWCALLVSSCTLHVAAFPYRNCRVMRCMACCLCAARLGEGQALRLPSGGAMPSCAVPCRRRGDHHLQGHRAVRHRGDI